MVKKVEDREPEGRAGESRLARWSRLKSEAAAEQQSKPETMTAARVPAETAPATAEAERQKKVDEVTKDLPPIESLGKDSDYALFMREGVPEDIRTAALRKLWRSDPAFTEPFPFEMHMEDYNKTFVPIVAATDTLYRAGIGYLFDDDKTEKEKNEASEKAGGDASGESPITAQKEIESAPRENALGETPEPSEKKSDKEQNSILGKKERG